MALRMKTILTLAMTGLMGTAGAQAASLEDAIEKLGGAPCSVGELTCVNLEVPLNHFGAEPNRTLSIEFSVSFASEESKGTMVYVVGGPGGSGISSADDYLSYFDERATQYLDIVFFDQRGMGPDHGIECPLAQGVFDGTAASFNNPDDVIHAAQLYVESCLAEIKETEILGYVDTEQAIRDLELFRQAIGGGKIWLYGESYGTQFAQQYATAFPDALEGVVLDGIVDLTLDAEGFYASYTRASEAILDRVFAACEALADCASDMEGDPNAVLTDLLQRAAAGTLVVDYPLGDGTSEPRALTEGMVESVAFYALYNAEARAGFLRELAAASRGNLLPLLRDAYSSLLIDPATLEGYADPTWFGAAYYAVTCSDYAVGQGSPGANAAAIIEEAKAFATTAPRLLRSYYLERLVCAFWPHQGPEHRPAAYAGGSFPTLMLNGDADPITPIDQSHSIFAKADNAYLITMHNGPHVIIARGYSCPDESFYQLLLDGTPPAAREQSCTQDLLADYTPLSLPNDAFALARSLEIEFDWHPELYNWDGEAPLSVGCDFGGTVTLNYKGDDWHYKMRGCSFWQGLSVTGEGLWGSEDSANPGWTFDLTVSGTHKGQLTYRHDSVTDTYSLAGTYDGQEASVRMTP